MKKNEKDRMLRSQWDHSSNSLGKHLDGLQVQVLCPGILTWGFVCTVYILKKTFCLMLCIQFDTLNMNLYAYILYHI